MLTFVKSSKQSNPKTIAKNMILIKMEELIMENYGRCKDCEYGEPTDCSWKWSCTWYHTLEDPDELKDCNHYRERD